MPGVMNMRRTVDSLSKGLAIVTSWVSVGTATVMIVSLLLGVFYRYVLQSALSWSGEVALLAFTWTVFLMASVGLREGFHARISLLDDFLKPWAKFALHRVLLITIGVFLGYLIVIGWHFVEFSAHLKSPATGYPFWLRNASCPTMAALGLVHVAAKLICGNPIEGEE